MAGYCEASGLVTYTRYQNMVRCGNVLILLTILVQNFVTISSEKMALKTANMTNNSIPHNISGLTNKTLDDGMGFTCKETRPLELLLSAVAGAFILSGIVLLTVGKLFTLLHTLPAFEYFV